MSDIWTIVDSNHKSVSTQTDFDYANDIAEIKETLNNINNTLHNPMYAYRLYNITNRVSRDDPQSKINLSNLFSFSSDFKYPKS